MTGREFAAVAAKYIGCCEGDGTHQQFCDTYNSYVRDCPRIENLPRKTQMDYSWAWCAVFVSAIGIETGLAMQEIPVEMSCTNMIVELISMGRWMETDSYKPAPGDIVFFDFAGSSSTDSKGIQTVDHVGIVEKVENGYIHTIEGNSADAVRRNAYQINDKRICGFGVPHFDCAEQEPEEPVPTVPTSVPTITIELHELRRGDQGDEVKALQSLLNGKQPTLSVDGSYGPKTEAAVIALQKELQKINGCVPDGIVGKLTWTKLLKGG